MSLRPRICVIRDGPYLVTGGVPLVRLVKEDGVWLEGEVVEDGRLPYTVCRCGGSSKSQACDNCHSEVTWDIQRELVRVPRPVKWDVPSSAPCVALKPDGPLRVHGLELTADDGTIFEPADRSSLCRCGHSNTMPFCDGTHKEVGFRDR